MIAVIVVDLGLLLGVAGLLFLAKPLKFLGMLPRRAGVLVLLAGVALVATGILLPAPLLPLPPERSRLDQFVPACQFREVHAIRIRAPRRAVYQAVKSVTAREIRFFRFLTWLRSPRLSRAGPENILNAPADKPVLDVALRSGFLLLADDPGRELVFGTVLCGRVARVSRPVPKDFLELDRPGLCKVAMNFRLEEEAGGGVRLSTETRVLALDAAARRRFAAYWRVILPGSALIRKAWLEAIRRRAEDPALACADEMRSFTEPVDAALAGFEAVLAARDRTQGARAAEAVLAEARLAREKLEVAAADPECAASRRETLLFVNHLVLGFQTWIGLGSRNRKDDEALASIIRRARAHQRKALTPVLPESRPFD